MTDWRCKLSMERRRRPVTAMATDPFIADESRAPLRAVAVSCDPDDGALGFRNQLQKNALGPRAGQALAPRNPGFDDIGGRERLARRAWSAPRGHTPPFHDNLRAFEPKPCGRRPGPARPAQRTLMDVFAGMPDLCQSSRLGEPTPCVSKEGAPWLGERRLERIVRTQWAEREDHFPPELADIARFLAG